MTILIISLSVIAVLIIVILILFFKYVVSSTDQKEDFKKIKEKEKSSFSNAYNNKAKTLMSCSEDTEALSGAESYLNATEGYQGNLITWGNSPENVFDGYQGALITWGDSYTEFCKQTEEKEKEND